MNIDQILEHVGPYGAALAARRGYRNIERHAQRKFTIGGRDVTDHVHAFDYDRSESRGWLKLWGESYTASHDAIGQEVRYSEGGRTWNLGRVESFKYDGWPGDLTEVEIEVRRRPMPRVSCCAGDDECIHA